MAFSHQILRPDDLLCLTIEGDNLRLDTTNPGAPVLVHEDPARDAFLVAVFPPQSFAEEALMEVDRPGAPATREAGAYGSRLSGSSRLAFRVPPGTVIPFSIEGLLDWSTLEPHLTPIGALRGQPGFVGGPGPPIVPPAWTETAIELPYRLIISPGPDARWRHRAALAIDNGRSPLWHTRLVIAAPGQAPVELDADHTSPIRAVFSPDYDPDNVPALPPADAFVMALKPADRHGLVRLTSTFTRPVLGIGTDVGLPANVRRLALTSLGGFIEAEGSWPNGPPKFSLSGWSHVAVLGRDSYVRVSNRGRLFPLMNRATMVTITERRFEPSPDGSPVACLRQFVRILLDEKDVTYDDLPFANAGRQMPLARVRVNVDATPKIENPSFAESFVRFIPSAAGGQTGSFEVKLGDAFWPFPCTAVDRAGHPVDFAIGMIFVPEEDIPRFLPDVAAHYRALPADVKAAAASPAKIKLADFASTSETTAFIASSFEFDVDLGSGPAGFLPKLSKIGVRVPSLELLTGSPKPTAIRFSPSYLANGFDPAAGLFAEIVDKGGLGVGFAADQAGGIVRPDLSVRGFSRDMGPIAGDLTNITAGTFDPKTAFGALDAKLFGSLPISDILGTNDLAEGAPKITTGLDPSSPGQVVTSLTWKTRTQPRSIGPVDFKPASATRLSITSVLRKSLPGAGAAQSQTTVDGVLNDFSIELLEVVRIHFESFRFSSGTGKATQVDVALRGTDPIEFKGGLAFVAKLTELIPPGVFGDSGPRLTLRPDAIQVSLSVPLPPAAIGIFSIRNIAVSTALTLPFLSGRPSLAFAFSTRERPFEIAVLILGGGGFVRVELDTEGVRCVEVMLEFGGVVALDVGVATGAVHILAGIYVGIKGSESELTGYVRVGGEVRVIMIVSLSIEFMLSLTLVAGPIARGVAKVTVSVRIAFISKSVSFSVEREFSGGSGHLSIGDAMTHGDWARYAAAFA